MILTVGRIGAHARTLIIAAGGNVETLKTIPSVLLVTIPEIVRPEYSRKFVHETYDISFFAGNEEVVVGLDHSVSDISKSSLTYNDDFGDDCNN